MNNKTTHNVQHVKPATVKCPKCWKQVRVTKAGMLYFHLREKFPYDAGRTHCAGSGMKP